VGGIESKNELEVWRLYAWESFDSVGVMHSVMAGGLC